MENIIDKIYEYSLEEIMGERFGRYSKYIIQDRAIPDVRDGLKPVQRRILYGMYREKNTYDHPYRKSAKSVGVIMGNYHPHGDSSIYDAMVRMSQWWKQNTTYIDMHGNNGSMDGDSPAAMRYTEARLSKISNELLKDLDRNTVAMAPNFDDTELEPTVLPAKFPNLLVNGTMGISAGYATNIPPHNLGEAIDATIKRIDSPNCRLETIMEIVKGPDFPTGGIIEGIDEIKKAYTTGRGRIIVKSRTKWEDEKGKLTLAVSEIPYEVNKALLVKKIDEIRIDKKIEGMIEVRDESDKDGLRIAIDCKKDANRELILNYLLKNTDLQVTYNFNMVAIVNRCPKQLGIIEMLDAYIAHHKEVVLRRTEFDLEHAKSRYHIVEGLIKCLSILDEVIRVIRASKNKSDAKDNLVKEFDFTEKQAEAIVMLQLYRLTNTDVVSLEEEMENLRKMIKGLELILSDENVLKTVMKEELRRVKKEYATPRKTDIKDEITEIKIDTTVMIPKEDVIVSVTKDGYIKRTSLRSYQASSEDTTLKDGDYLIGLFELNTLDTLLVFTNKGNYFHLPVHELPICVWKDMGKHLSNVVRLDSGEEIISVIPVTDFNQKLDILIATKNGMIKRTALEEFKTSRSLKPITCIKLKDNDTLIAAMITKYNDLFIGTNKSYGLWYDVSEIPVVGLRTSGVKSINLKDDYVVGVSNFDESAEYISILTDKGTGKRIKLSDFEKTSRAKRGLLILREVKTNPYRIIKTFVVNSKEFIGIKNGEIKIIKSTELPILDRYSTGSQIIKGKIDTCFINVELIKKEDLTGEVKITEEKEVKKVSLKEIDDRLMTIDDFINIDE
ncbi:MAG: DNA topoisomerase IV subunit A [Bacilli bacterium]|nr:DNA topoisomerase IV subunit A [Bacilli bacterium]